MRLCVALSGDRKQLDEGRSNQCTVVEEREQSCLNGGQCLSTVTTDNGRLVSCKLAAYAAVTCEIEIISKLFQPSSTSV